MPHNKIYATNANNPSGIWYLDKYDDRSVDERIEYLRASSVQELMEAAKLMKEVLGFIRETYTLKCTPSGNFYSVDLNKDSVDGLYENIKAALEHLEGKS
jgi:hypothetical protein